MSCSRFAVVLRRLVAGALLALPLACLELGSSVAPSRTELAVAGMVLECPVGSLGCPCTGGGGCDPGLVCMAGTCTYADQPMGAEADANYEFAGDLAAPAPAPPREIAAERSQGRGGGRSKHRAKREARLERQTSADSAAAETVEQPAAMVQPGSETSEPVDDPLLGDPAAQRRQVIYTATLQVAVYERDAAIELAESLPDRWGGWIESRYDYQITLRIPAERLFEAIAELSELGVVLGKTLQADDVTAEYVDLESRIRVLEQIVAQLELLLAQATSVEQALEIRVELDRIRIELEAARARMRQLSELIDFSTLTLLFSQRGPDYDLPSSNDPFSWVDELGLEATEYR